MEQGPSVGNHEASSIEWSVFDGHLDDASIINPENLKEAVGEIPSFYPESVREKLTTFIKLRAAFIAVNPFFADNELAIKRLDENIQSAAAYYLKLNETQKKNLIDETKRVSEEQPPVWDSVKNMHQNDYMDRQERELSFGVIRVFMISELGGNLPGPIGR